MANFLSAFSKTITYEGGWVKDPKDPGGETYLGVARRFHPHWLGWPLVDAIKGKKHGDLIDSAMLRKHVKDFYQHNFWRKIKGDDILSQRVASFIFDFAVNSGGAIREVQKVLGVPDDGVIGPKTLAAINAVPESTLMNRLINARLAYVQRLVKNDPDLFRFLKGWTNRINSFK